MVDYTRPPTIKIFDRNLVKTTEISPEVYDYFAYQRELRSHGSFTLHINANQPKAQYLLDADAFLVEYFDGVQGRAGIIESVECTIDSSGAAGQNLIITGREGGTFAERIALANTKTGTGYDTISGPAETVMRHYVSVNCISPLDAMGNSAPNRKVPELVLEPTDQGRGQNVSYSARLETILDILETVSAAGDIGWQVVFDRENADFMFSIIEGEDKTNVVLKPEYHTVESLQYRDDRMNSKTFVYVGGSGEGSARTIASAYLGDTEPSGFDRRELFVDLSNATTQNELTTAGVSELITRAPSISIAAVAASNATRYEYQVDYDLGDFVTVDFTGIATAQVRIVGVLDETVKGDRGNVRKITLNMGTEPADIRRVIRRSAKAKPEERR